LTDGWVSSAADPRVSSPAEGVGQFHCRPGSVGVPDSNCFVRSARRSQEKLQIKGGVFELRDLSVLMKSGFIPEHFQLGYQRHPRMMDSRVDRKIQVIGDVR
jgi:hypothetical protein